MQTSQCSYALHLAASATLVAAAAGRAVTGAADDLDPEAIAALNNSGAIASAESAVAVGRLARAVGTALVSTVTSTTDIAGGDVEALGLLSGHGGHAGSEEAGGGSEDG